jgi:RNA polymerase sigma-B factor
VPTGDRDTAIDPGRPDDRFGDLEQQWFVSHLLSTLGDAERDMVRMRFMEGLSQAQIATQIGKSQMHVSRALAKTFVRMRALAESQAAAYT